MLTTANRPHLAVVHSCKEGFIVGGILLGYLASALWVCETGGWRYMYGAALPPALIVFAGMVSHPCASGSLLSSANETRLAFLEHSRASRSMRAFCF